MEAVLWGCAVFGLLVIIFVFRIILSMRSNLKALREESSKVVERPPAPVVHVDLSSLKQAIEGLPSKVLHSIQSSTNTKKGALGELIGYIELEAQYDRIIPLGNIVDFMCIKFPDASKQGMSSNGIMREGRVDFVDIKTGKSSRLSKEQRMLQQLIKDKKVNFVKLTVNTQASDETEPTTD